MSSPSVRHESVREGTTDESAVERGISMMSRPLRTVGFWAAVSLPFLHVPLLLSGLDSTADTLAFAALFSLNLFALVLGHGHDPN